MYVKREDGTSHVLPSDQFIALRPRLTNQSRPYTCAVNRCDVAIFVAKDFTRVFIGGSEWGFEGVVREADNIEIEALAERFNYDELRKVALMRAKK